MKKTRGDAAAVRETATWINRHWWLAGLDLEVEREQAQDEGRELGPTAREFDRLLGVALPEGQGGKLGGRRDARWLADAWALLDAVQARPMRRGYAYVEPDELAGICAARGRGVRLPAWRGSQRQWVAQVHGGWLGRIAGCMLGKPVEGWRLAQIERLARATGNWPLTDYFRWPTAAESRRIRQDKAHAIFRKGMPHQVLSTLPGMQGGCEDDDLNYTVTGFALVKQFGGNFTPQDVSTFWLNHIPLLHTCTAERVAYGNLAACVPPPWSATRRNPYREWIGAQIRADYFGYANPGQPARAAAWAWRDASISHVRNGIYGEMWVAAMLAAAFVERDWRRVIRAGLAEIPARSRLHAAIAHVLELHAAGARYDEVVADVRARWNEANAHHWCHTISNAEIVAVGLLWGEDDFGKTITRAVMPGFDTDCNGATCGSLWGVMHGADAIPRAWARPLRDRVCTGVAGYHDTSIAGMAAEMVRVASVAR